MLDIKQEAGRRVADRGEALINAVSDALDKVSPQEGVSVLASLIIFSLRPDALNQPGGLVTKQVLEEVAKACIDYAIQQEMEKVRKEIESN